jgi:hypothetical protein
MSWTVEALVEACERGFNRLNEPKVRELEPFFGPNGEDETLSERYCSSSGSPPTSRRTKKKKNSMGSRKCHSGTCTPKLDEGFSSPHAADRALQHCSSAHGKHAYPPTAGNNRFAGASLQAPPADALPLPGSALLFGDDLSTSNNTTSDVSAAKLKMLLKVPV